MARFLTILSLAVLSFGTAVAETDQAVFGPVEKIVVVADVHGDFERFVEILQTAKVIDSKQRWSAGKTHLVQLGDIPDRGPDTRKIFDFLEKLERSAKRKGGQVHVLIGNHEAMNMYGDVRYVTPEEYAAFATRDSKRYLEKLYEKEIEWVKENLPEEEWPTFDEDFKAQWFEKRPPGFYEQRIAWLPDGEMGKRVLPRNAVIKIGDTLFMHGGLGPQYSNWTIEDLNSSVRKSLESLTDVEGSILRAEEGPIWYRGLALNPESEETPNVEALLENFDVKRIVLGHTVMKGLILPRFGGRVILADVGLSRFYGGNPACLVIEGDDLFAVYQNGRVKLPTTDGDEALLAYLNEVQQLEPENMFVRKRIESLVRGEEVAEGIEVLQ